MKKLKNVFIETKQKSEEKQAIKMARMSRGAISRTDSISGGYNEEFVIFGESN